MHGCCVQDDAYTILVVDGEPRIVDLVASMLRLVGYRVIEAADGTQALQIVSGGQVDLVITDVKIPGIDGIELAGRLRRVAPGVPVLFMSGCPDPTPCLFDVIEKPFHMTQLHESVARALRARVC